ncbi:hypothetical protein G9C01_00300 [Blattabacterium sp. DPU]|nr:hypothetical protein G9C01_00300 [Blattabacterium sp. DPU]
MIFLLLSPDKTFSHSNNIRETVQIIHADIIDNYHQSFVLIGNVHLKYRNNHLFCDKIIYDKKIHKFYGYGNVNLESGKNKIISQNIEGNFSDFQLSGKVVLYREKIKLIANIVNFNLKKKLFKAINNVVLFFGKNKLQTNTLEYNLILNQIFYKKNSIIHYGDFTISSKEGFFYLNKKKIELKYEIQLINENYIIYANALEYLLEQDQVNFLNTAIFIQKKNFDNFIYANKAFFSLKKKIFLFKNYVSIHYNGRILKGKYLFFDHKKKCGFIEDLLLEDPNKKYFLTSGYGKFDFHSNSLTLERNPKIIKTSKNNSIFIYSNILKINIEKNNAYSIQAFSVESFFLNQNFNENIQGKCNFLNYKSSNNYIQFDGNPIFWGKNRQISGDVISIHFEDNENHNFLKKIKIIQNAFYTEKINSKEFNQIKGDIMIGFFNKNYLEKVMVEGNINSIIFLNTHNKEKKIMNRLSCKILSIYFDQSKKINKISSSDEVYSELIPIHNKEIYNKFLYLPKFSWKEKNKPHKKFFAYKEMDKYKKESLLEKVKMKNIIKNK